MTMTTEMVPVSTHPHPVTGDRSPADLDDSVQLESSDTDTCSWLCQSPVRVPVSVSVSETGHLWSHSSLVAYRSSLLTRELSIVGELLTNLG